MKKLRQIKNYFDYLKEDFERFTISQVAIIIRNDKFLILRCSKRGQWLLPGGRMDKGELRSEAFHREIKEEIGFEEFKELGIITWDVWYTKNNRPVCGVANLIENHSDEIRLSFEHSEFKWVELNELENYDFVWPKEIVFEMVKKGFELKELLKKDEK